MSTPYQNECHHCKRPFTDGDLSKLQSMLGTCKHHVCADCIEHKDTERRSINVAVGPYVPCPVLGCDQGHFDVPEKVVSSPQIVDVVSSAVAPEPPTPEKAKSGSNNINDISPGDLQISPDFVLSSGVVVTPIPLKVKSEEKDAAGPIAVKSGEFGYDSDDYSRFSEGFTSDHSININPKKEETDEDEGSKFSTDDRDSTNQPSDLETHPKKEETDEEERGSRLSDDEESRFSDVSGFSQIESGLEMEFSIEVEKDGPDLEAVAEGQKEGIGETVIKEEPTYAELQKRQAKNSRQYGDRVLLARQSKLGMLKLGGGNQGTEMWPVNDEERMARMGGRYCMAYNAMWNMGAPKYAGQVTAHVTHVPRVPNFDPDSDSFSVFVQRWVKQSTLGWEYCGEYVRLDDLRGVTAAHCISAQNKAWILNDITKSLRRENGVWHKAIESYRTRIMNVCNNDPSPPGPTRLIRFINNEPEPDDEGKEREDRLDRESRERASDAAKARALGLDNKSLSEMNFAKHLVHYDDFYGSYAVKFVRYDESIYNFLKEGATTKNKYNKRRETGEPCAKASDWYNIMDQQLDMSGQREKTQRKRKRT